MDEKTESRIKATYRETASVYRRNDELDATGKDHQRLCEILGMISNSFDRSIVVLDAGCGAGRYFHCLKNTRKLVGLDVSPEMLEEARHPVKEEEISIPELELVCGNVYTQSFPEQSFDLIYSIGVFGNGCGLTKALLTKFHDWLTPDGRIFFDVLDSSGLPRPLRARVRLRNLFHDFCPRPLRNLFGKRRSESLPLHVYSREQIIGLIESSGFFAVAVYPQECQMPLGQGRKLQCLGFKSDQNKSNCCGQVGGVQNV